LKKLILSSIKTCIEHEKENIPFGIVPWCSLLVIQKLWSLSKFQTILHVCVSLPFPFTCNYQQSPSNIVRGKNLVTARTFQQFTDRLNKQSVTRELRTLARTFQQFTTCLCVSPLSFHVEILLYQHSQSALDTSRTLFLLVSTQGGSCRLVMNHLIYRYAFNQIVVENRYWQRYLSIVGSSLFKIHMSLHLSSKFWKFWHSDVKYVVKISLRFAEGKLRTYLKIKTNFGYENYLSIIKNFEQRRRLSKLRISAHKNMFYRAIPWWLLAFI
jgi:hypothetical protein